MEFGTQVPMGEAAEEGEYLVMWHIYKRVQKKGVMNFLLGKKETIAKPVIQRFGSQEMAENGYRNLKLNGCPNPMLLRIVRE